MADNKVIWTPQPRQEVFMSRAEDEVFYGGAAGGGKSDAIVIEGLRQVHIPHYKGLLLRKTFPELTDLIDKSLNYYKQSFPRAKYNSSTHTWTFPSGARIIFGAMQHIKDKHKYQGKAYDYIAFDELTHFTLEEYIYLRSRNRPTGPGTRVYTRATGNPGGIGHGWVKSRFITAAKPGNTIWELATWRDNKGEEHNRWMSRVFIPSSLFDNKALMENDPDYVARLASLPEAERNALLYGDWNSFEGQVFTEWADNSEHYADRKCTHVISPFEVPKEWRIWRSMDWGYSRPFSVHWSAIDHDGRIYVIRELYGCNGTPNMGVKWEPSEVAQRIREVEAQDPNLKDRKIYGVADPAIFNDSGTESISVLMERCGVYFDRGDNRRIDGKMQIHHRLSFDERGVPMLYVFNTCPHLIRTLPTLVYSQTDVEDVDTTCEDHAYDEIRYLCMANPFTPKPKKPDILRPYNPLENTPAPESSRYDYYFKLR